MKSKVKKSLVRLVLTLICIVMVTLCCFFLTNLHRIMNIVCIIFFSALGVLIPSVRRDNDTLLKLLGVLAVLGAVTVVSYIILDRSGILYKLDEESVREFILSTKQWGVLTFFLITLLQVVILPIPAAVTIVLGSTIYGPWVSFAISTLGTILGSLISFGMGRSFGKRIVHWMFGAEQTKKYTEFLTKGKFAFIFMMIFPFFPDDLICMLAGLTNMTFKFFLIAMAISRTIIVAFYSFFGTGDIIPFSGWGIPVWVSLFCSLILAYLIISRLSSKRRTKADAKKERVGPEVD